MNILSNTLFSPRISNWLYGPTVNRVITELDDPTSTLVFPFRDTLENAGRTYQEWKRSPHGGRERFLEEILTTIVWGFGITFMKNKVYDPLVKLCTNVQLPSMHLTQLDRLTPELTEAFQRKFSNIQPFISTAQPFQPSSLLGKALYWPFGKIGQAYRFSKDTIYALVEKIAEKTAGKIPNSQLGFYEKLVEISRSPELIHSYKGSGLARLAIAIMIPVLTIAFGIPAGNQALTRHFIEQEKKAKASEKTPSFKGLLSPKQVSFAKPGLFRHFEGLSSPPFSPLLTPHFSGVAMDTASKLLQDNRAATLLIDGSLSGGRTLMARNPIERLEIILKEGSIVLFLYWVQEWVKEGLIHLTDKVSDTVGGFEFNSLDYLHKTYGSKTQDFLNHYKDRFKIFGEDLKGFEKLFDSAYINSFATKKEQKKALEPLYRNLEKAIQKLYLEGKTNSVWVQMAEVSGAIPTFVDKAGKRFLDLSQLIQGDRLQNLNELMGTMATKLEKEGASGIETLVRKSTTGRFWAWLGSHLICAVFLSGVMPWVQHQVTKLITGKDYFPGVEPEYSHR